MMLIFDSFLEKNRNIIPLSILGKFFKKYRN
jgi:hypothetical protein